MSLRENLAQRMRALNTWFTESGAKDWVKAVGSAVGDLAEREANWNAAIAPLELRALEELQRGRDSFAISLDISKFPEANPDDYEQITYKAEKRIADGLPLRCTDVRHANSEGVAVLTFERVIPEPPAQHGDPLPRQDAPF